MKLVSKLISTLLFTLSLAACQSEESHTAKVGVIVPLEHKALQEIVEGFSQKLKETYPGPVQIKIMNAQGDMNLQRAIITQMKNQGYNIIVPIGMDATEMTMATARGRPIVSLAAEISEAERQKNQPCHLAIVHDEIPQHKLMEFIHTAYPDMKKLFMIHSTSNKVLPEVKAAIEAAKQYGIEVKHTMVATLPELLNATQMMPNNTQGIFILKDHLIVSGISTLAKAAKDRHIPLFTSDQGSVEAGAGIALGVHERAIGIEGGKVAASVLSGKPICDIPIVEMKQLTVFINQSALASTMQNVEQIKTAAKNLHYQTEFMQEK